MRTGRPREFDEDKALEKAMRVFWKKGYEGATLLDLTRTMGINRPSLYAAYGNKEELFRRVIDKYSNENGPAGAMCKALSQPTAQQTARMYLETSADALTCPKNPRGCLMIQGALVCSDATDPIKKELVNRRKSGEAALCKRFTKAVKDGDLASDVNPTDLARYIATVGAGMSIQAANGASRADLQAVVEAAMRGWPG